MRGYRNEHKYSLSPAQYRLIRGRIAPLMKIDEHAEGDRYAVRSLYFESAANTSYLGKKAGVYSRCKYRLRMYRFDPLTLKFEQKLKKGDQVRKRGIRLSVDAAKALMNADYSPLFEMDERAIYYDLVSERFMPSLIIDYVREPYVYKPANIRITFDSDVVVRPKTGDFFREITPGIPVHEGDAVIMEVKFDDWLPVWLKAILQVGVGSRRSISKYCLGFSSNPFLQVR